MPTSPNLMAERFAEVRAVAAIQSVVRILDDLSREPSGKRFINSRASRKERWAQLAQEAAIRVNELSAAVPKAASARRAAPKPRVVAPSPALAGGPPESSDSGSAGAAGAV